MSLYKTLILLRQACAELAEALRARIESVEVTGAGGKNPSGLPLLMSLNSDGPPVVRNTEGPIEEEPVLRWNSFERDVTHTLCTGTKIIPYDGQQNNNITRY